MISFSNYTVHRIPKRVQRTVRAALAFALAGITCPCIIADAAEQFPASQASNFSLDVESEFVLPVGFASAYLLQETGDEEASASSNEGGEEEESDFDVLKSKFEDLEEKLAKMEDSGRVHVDAWGFDHDDNIDAIAENDTDEANRLGFRRLRFGVKGKIKDNMVYKIEMELANGNMSEFRDAYLGWTVHATTYSSNAPLSLKRSTKMHVDLDCNPTASLRIKPGTGATGYSTDVTSKTKETTQATTCSWKSQAVWQTQFGMTKSAADADTLTGRSQARTRMSVAIKIRIKVQ